MPGNWAGSHRRAELPPDWPLIVDQILARDHRRCQFPDEQHPGICGRPATDVDHIGDRHDHRPQNLQAACEWHHDRKSSAQGNAARRRWSSRRPPEPHPGSR